MQLRTARLCLDCEELHEENTCPVCASEMFAFLTRWVPAEERRAWEWGIESAILSARKARQRAG